ncbi:hypothetical protein CgunFtcFv8_005141 [Champsocephalus gunnari]|uniref:Uncharacterized protein n=1 Tax=Champsocephalus gunnari TaxID=52237 RepID=A0AAN8CZQ8_CHAGU|nr:hypothetical protein CgunFtcFv8_005141 [Champsocephalus gunnari]
MPSVSVGEWIASPPVCGGLFQLLGDVFVTGSPSSRRRPSAQAGAEGQSQSVLHRPALRHTVPSCSRWCQALNPAADVTYSDKRESHQ